MKFHITFPNGESLYIELKSKELKGICLVDKVFEHLDLYEDTNKYFALSYVDKYDGGRNWVNDGDNLRTLNGVQLGGVMQLQFGVYIFPTDPHLVFTTAVSRRLFRQYMKNIILNDLMRWEIENLAELDALIAQAELGDHDSVKNDYPRQLNNLEIYLPTYVISETPVTEHQYLKKVLRYHTLLKGMSSVKADIMFLNKVQMIPNYGYVFHRISDSIREQYFIALSPHGLHFIYVTSIEKAISCDKKESFTWNDFVEYRQIDQKQFKLKLLMTANTKITRKFKIKSNHSHKDSCRFKSDIERYKEVYCEDIFPQNTLPCKGNPRQLIQRPHTMRPRPSYFI